MKESYSAFLARKQFRVPDAGFDSGNDPLNSSLFDWQRAITRWAIRKGRAAIFAECGLGKTIQQLSWSDAVRRRTGGDVIIAAPLAVAEQTEEEALKFGISDVHVCRHGSEVKPGITITNYEMIHDFDTSRFAGVVLDESSCLKAHDSKTRNDLTSRFALTPYRLCCSATPAPNDHMELATHAEFLGAMKRSEMLSMFFVHDGGDTSKWRLKKHAVDSFWKWVCSWAVVVRRPSDLGFSDEGFALRPIRRVQIEVPSEAPDIGMLFAVEARTLDERRLARRNSLDRRVSEAAYIVNEKHRDEPFILWCDLNAESAALAAVVPDAVEITGSDSLAVKRAAMSDFTHGRIRGIVSKPSICGWGMNWQHCRVMAFVGLSDSFEQVYQAERRCWRFGQSQDVISYTITSEAEGAVVRNQERKLAEFELMGARMVEHMKDEMQTELGLSREARIPYSPTVEMKTPEWLKEIA